MGEKIVNLRDMGKQIEPTLPIEHDAIVKNLRDASDDFVNEYLDVIGSLIEDLLICSNIITARYRPNIFRYLFTDLNNTQIEHLGYISLHLASKNPQERVKELARLTFNCDPSTPEGLRKAIRLLEQIQSLDIKSKFLGHIQLLNDILIVLNIDERFSYLIVDRLSRLDEGDFDDLNLICEALEKVKKYQ